MRIEVMKEKLAMEIAWRMPRWLVYWCAVRVGADATTRDDMHRFEGNVPDMTFLDALKRWT